MCELHILQAFDEKETRFHIGIGCPGRRLFGLPETMGLDRAASSGRHCGESGGIREPIVHLCVHVLTREEDGTSDLLGDPVGQTVQATGGII